MEFEQFKFLAKGMKAVYAQQNFLPDADSVKLWYGMLRDLNYDVCSAAIQSYMMTAKFPPTIADIRELAAGVQNGPTQDWGEAWNYVSKVIRETGMYRQEEAMQQFTGITKEVVERLGYLNLCRSENVTADRANFRTIYEQIQERRKKEAQIPDRLKLAVQNIQIGIKERQALEQKEVER